VETLQAADVHADQYACAKRSIESINPDLASGGTESAVCIGVYEARVTKPLMKELTRRSN